MAASPIRFGVYNIRNGRNEVLDSALQGMLQAYVNLGVFQETKATTRIYTQEYRGYRVVASEAPSAHSSRIAVSYRATEHFFVKAFQIHGENVASFQMELGGQRWYIVGCYLDPDDASTI